ncbi:hypothetical protein LT493_44220 [Streptomyces tricolor]|nr:hypothetical protein [Streptomyces tricolor]
MPDHALNASLLPRPLRLLLDSPVDPRLEGTLRCFLEHAGSIPAHGGGLGSTAPSLYYRLRQIQGDHRPRPGPRRRCSSGPCTSRPRTRNCSRHRPQSPPV